MAPINIPPSPIKTPSSKSKFSRVPSLDLGPLSGEVEFPDIVEDGASGESISVDINVYSMLYCVGKFSQGY